MPPVRLLKDFPKTALSRRVGDVLAAAAAGPVSLTDHGKRRLVLMTVAQFEQLCGLSDSGTGERIEDMSLEEEALLLDELEDVREI